MATQKQTNLTALERFMGGNAGKAIAYTMVALLVIIVGWALLNGLRLVDANPNVIPLPFRLMIVLFTPALLSSYRRCRRKCQEQ